MQKCKSYASLARLLEGKRIIDRFKLCNTCHHLIVLRYLRTSWLIVSSHIQHLKWWRHTIIWKYVHIGKNPFSRPIYISKCLCLMVDYNKKLENFLWDFDWLFLFQNYGVWNVLAFFSCTCFAYSQGVSAFSFWFNEISRPDIMIKFWQI